MNYFHFIRHGKTQGNIKKQYIGKTDESLCPEGKEELYQNLRIGRYPGRELVSGNIFASPMKRCMETANILYPDCNVESLPDLREMDFGAYEGKTYEQLKDLKEYRQWIESEGAICGQGMESKEAFQNRCKRAFCALLDRYDKLDNQHIVLIVHGGTIMAIMEEFAHDKRGYYGYRCENGGMLSCCWRKEPGAPTLQLMEDER